MKVLSLFSTKGGVGKTAAAVNLAYFAAQRGRRTLLLDLDAQGAAGFYFRVRPSGKARGKSLLGGRKSVANLIRESDFKGLDILPAAPGLRNIDRRLDRECRKRHRLTPVFESLNDLYDSIVVDCPPQLGLLSENIINLSDTLLVPVIPSILSARTLEQTYDFFKRKEYPARKILPFFSMVNASKRLHRDTMDSIDRKNMNFLVTTIPNSTEVERMGLARKPLVAYNPRSKAGMAFTALGMELEMRGCL